MSDVEFKGMSSDETRPRVKPKQAALTPAEAVAVDAVYQRTKDEIWRRARSKAGSDQALAEEIFQEAYLRLMLNWSADVSHRGTTEQLHWLRGAVRRLAKELPRQRTDRDRLVSQVDDGDRRPAGPGRSGDDVMSLEDDAVGQMVFEGVLKDAREVLSDRQFEAFRYKALGFSTQEIAVLQGTTPGTVRSQLMKARIKLLRKASVCNYIYDIGRGSR